mmetsp:Transcript_48943/g.49696  ORF Transcript_48943/g.49696 Transcript_48943/m.49696 type:complete len:93 (+) Transcript_48943:938-1216(+)
MGTLYQGNLYLFLSRRIIQDHPHHEQNHNGSSWHVDRQVDICRRRRIQYDIAVDALYLDLAAFLLCGIRLLLRIRERSVYTSTSQFISMECH